jgi:tripartite-type tricarboxylate transporter receptor subunit TctC
VKDYECYTWNAVFAPPKTPKPVVDRLVEAMKISLADPAVVKKLQDIGIDPTPNSSPEQLAAFVKAELAKWGPIVKASGAQLD